MIQVPVGIEWDSVRFHHTTQNGMQFKTYELFFLEVFIQIFSAIDCGKQTVESETADGVNNVFCLFFNVVVWLWYQSNAALTV